LKKKLLIITRWYLPATKSGGTVRSILALVNGLKEYFDITILTSDRDLGSNSPYENIEFDKLIDSNGVSIAYLSKLDVKNIEKYINIVNPDIIYINSFFDIMTQGVMLLKLFGKIKSKIVVLPRGELGNGALSIKSTKKKIYLFIYKLLNISKGIIFQATSKEEYMDINRIFPSNKIEIIQNAKVENNNSYPLPLKEINSLKTVFLSRIAVLKNLDYALEILRDYTFDGFIEFDIYGPLEDKEYWAKCENIINRINESQKNIKVSYKGFVEPENISKTLSNYHLFFMPTKGENFGHAIVEAMKVGLVPLISNQTPWQNLENIDVGFSLDLNNKESFVTALNQVLLLNNENFLDKSINVKSYINKKVNNKKTLSEYLEFFLQY